MVDGCGDQRPRLRLVVDNTACGSRGAPHSGYRSTAAGGESGAGEPGSIAVELGAWLQAVARLIEARWRLARQRLVNRLGLPSSSGRAAGLAPVVGVVAVVVFGALFGLRFVQESGSPDDVVGSVGSVAAVAASTSSAVPSSAVEAAAGAGRSVVVVHPGDSLWSIAVERYPEHDPRQVVEAFVEVNGASTIHSGQQLIVPPALDRD